MLLNVESSIAATKELLLVPETLALSEQRLIYDSNLNLMWQPSKACLPAPLCPPDWQEVDGEGDKLLGSLASTLLKLPLQF